MSSQALESLAVEAVLFDFDGTLVDASRAICRSFDTALRRFGAPVMPEDRVKAMIGRPLREMFAVADPSAAPERLEDYVEAYREAWLPLAVPLTTPLPTAAETVRQLASSGIRLAVVTSRIASGAERILDAFALRAHFAVVVGVEHVDRPKPDPEGLRVALSALGVAADGAVMVGDTPDDVAAGRAAGTCAVGVTTGAYDESSLSAAGAHVVLGRLWELVERLSLAPES
jgi:HAD superfamily hydrolase (TIGR01509 family)